MNHRGLVFWNEIPAATIAETDAGYEFAYLDSWLNHPAPRPVSLTLPGVLNDTPALNLLPPNRKTELTAMIKERCARLARY